MDSFNVYIGECYAGTLRDITEEEATNYARELAIEKYENEEDNIIYRIHKESSDNDFNDDENKFLLN